MNRAPSLSRRLRRRVLSADFADDADARKEICAISVICGCAPHSAKTRHQRAFIELLAHSFKNLIITVMKLALAVLVYVLIGVVLGAGILLTVAGKPWFLIAAVHCLRGRVRQNRLHDALKFGDWQSRSLEFGDRQNYRHSAQIQPSSQTQFHFCGTGNFCCIAGLICVHGRPSGAFRSRRHAGRIGRRDGSALHHIGWLPR